MGLHAPIFSYEPHVAPRSSRTGPHCARGRMIQMRRTQARGAWCCAGEAREKLRSAGQAGWNPQDWVLRAKQCEVTRIGRKDRRAEAGRTDARTRQRRPPRPSRERRSRCCPRRRIVQRDRYKGYCGARTACGLYGPSEGRGRCARGRGEGSARASSLRGPEPPWRRLASRQEA
ncbi:hypothetical protein B0H15DRAFT_824725 [Mycena belliarum]|uniref:Uncharacterized protein n=1 Tax=Mycena belliarum TaxID=1033014 RepID=A0AAD6XUP2_9AGAR|nr:hypothetical protein B0H15DRAFT_824725 [Mycena belliae]